MSETRIRIRLLRIYFPWISEFGPASEFRGRGGVEPPNPPRYATAQSYTADKGKIFQIIHHTYIPATTLEYPTARKMDTLGF
jgi:hypothetical protein